jgi:Fic family protein
MQRDKTGQYTRITSTGEEAMAFIPLPLPPDPPIQWTPSLMALYEKALVALGRLDSASGLIPDTNLFLYMYVRKEAVLSSMIEGTQSSLSDLLIHEVHGAITVPMDDVEEVVQYVKALNHGISRLQEGFPLSLRLIKEIHGILLSSGRGRHQNPGEFRQSQNWIGGSRPCNAKYVPPPPEALMECLGALEKFLHNQPGPTPSLIKAALAHVQFETIHPFLDGNGRLGRLLITLVLLSEGVMREPLLYLSLYFKTYRQEYYELLNNIRKLGVWEAWLEFFFQAVVQTSQQAYQSAKDILDLARSDRQLLGASPHNPNNLLRIYEVFLRNPINTAARLKQQTGLTMATVNSILHKLEAKKIIFEITGGKRNRVYSYSKLLLILDRGTELPK